MDCKFWASVWINFKIASFLDSNRDKEEEIGKKLLEEVSFYDQIVNTVSKGVVCADCLDKDDELYNKFRKNG